MRSNLVRGTLVLGAVALLGSLVVEPNPRPVLSGVTPLYLDLVDVPFRPGRGPSLQTFVLPPNGSVWNELYPNFGTARPQQNLIDNGDTFLSIGDVMRFSGIDYFVSWAGPTYLMNCGATSTAWEPNLGPHNDTNPIGETWSEIHPNFGATVLVTGWTDNGDTYLSSGDILVVQVNGGAPTTCTINATGCDVTLDPVPVVPSEKITWGELKSLITGR